MSGQRVWKIIENSAGASAWTPSTRMRFVMRAASSCSSAPAETSARAVQEHLRNADIQTTI